MALKIYLNCLNISYTNNSGRYIYDSYLRAKTTKIYYHDPQKQAKWPYQYIYIDLVKSINLIGFVDKRYFFTFTDDATWMIDIYTGTKKNNWLKCLKAYHSLCKTRFKNNHPIKQLRSDYGFKLPSHKANEWIKKKSIIFESLAPYSQEQNRMSK